MVVQYKIKFSDCRNHVSRLRADEAWGNIDTIVLGPFPPADLPFRCHRDVNRNLTEEVLKEAGRPRLSGLPTRGGASHDEGGVPGHISHELERAGFLIELVDDDAVQLKVRRDELGDGVCQ